MGDSSIYYEGAERQRQLIKNAIQQKANGADRRGILENARSFNNTSNNPPLSESDVKGLLDILDTVQNEGRLPKNATVLEPYGPSKYEVRTVTLPSGRKVKMRGAEIIGVE
jgi:hypothetical protein